MGKAFGFDLQGLDLAILRRRALDFFDHMSQVIRFAAHVLAAARELLLAPLQVTQPLMRVAHRRPLHRLHPQGGKGRQKAGEGGRGEFEGAFDNRLLRAGANDVARRSLTEQEGERIDQHGLAGAGLSRQDVEPGGERERYVGDDGEVADTELREHYLRSRSERSPHCSFLRMRAKKPSGPRRTSSTGCAARFTTSRSPAPIVVPTCPSKETSTSSVEGGIGSTVTAAFDGTTSGRTASVCGQIAATTMASTLGTTIGPPAESAYAVDPVGVATTMPSDEYCPTSSPSTETRSRMTRATPPLCTTASFNTIGSARLLPCLSSMKGASARRDSVA